ncbi:MFS transporter [Streptomyces termitum]|uniref:MFS transporter n=1 Tax=Streptomyces termitum TaxID=67368 RepID=UPI0033B8EA96
MRKSTERARTPSARGHLAGALAARTGDEASGPALALAGFALTGTASGASALLACATASAAVGGPVLGVLLDRARRPGRLLAGALLLHAAGLVAVLAALGRLPFAVTATAAVVAGLAGPALSGGWTARLPLPAPAGRPDRLLALDALTFPAAALAGPALAGGAALLLGAPAAVVLAAALVASAAPVALLLPAAGPGSAAGREAGLLGAVAAGLRVVVRRRQLLRATAASVGCAAAQGMVAACAPALGAGALGGPGRGALLLSVAAAGALAATALHARLPRAVPPMAVLGTGALVQAGAWGLAATGGPVALVVAFAVAGAAEGPSLSALFAVRQEWTPPGLRGRVFTTGASLKITGFAAGAALAGPVAVRSLPVALLLAAGVCLVSALPCARAGRLRRRVRGGSCSGSSR